MTCVSYQDRLTRIFWGQLMKTDESTPRNVGMCTDGWKGVIWYLGWYVMIWVIIIIHYNALIHFWSVTDKLFLKFILSG